jgi:hypothetical protein
MKFDLVMVSVWLAAFAPMCVLLLAMAVDRCRYCLKFRQEIPVIPVQKPLSVPATRRAVWFSHSPRLAAGHK